jgi:hypothetical protein
VVAQEAVGAFEVLSKLGFVAMDLMNQSSKRRHRIREHTGSQRHCTYREKTVLPAQRNNIPKT